VAGTACAWSHETCARRVAADPVIIDRVRPLVLALAAALTLASPAVAQAPPTVLVVGDSLQVGSGPYLEAALGALSVEIDHRTGRGSAEGLSILRSRLPADHAAVVFDLGTNDDPSLPGALASDLAGARGQILSRCGRPGAAATRQHHPAVRGPASPGACRRGTGGAGRRAAQA
jgi:hypothetical protein